MDAHKLQLLHSSADCNWRTPPALYGALGLVFPFQIDLAATRESCQTWVDGTAYYLGPDHAEPSWQDALTVDWSAIAPRGVGFLNPPYSLTLYSQGLKAGTPRAQLQWLLVEEWARKAFTESERGFTTVAVMPYAPQTEWFRRYVMGHTQGGGWRGHAALDMWRIPHRVSFLDARGKERANANVNSCVVIWGPNPGFVGPWVPSGRYWGYRVPREPHQSGGK